MAIENEIHTYTRDGQNVRNRQLTKKFNKLKPTPCMTLEKFWRSKSGDIVLKEFLSSKAKKV